MTRRGRARRISRPLAAGTGALILVATLTACVTGSPEPRTVTHPDSPAHLAEVTVQRIEYPTSHEAPDPAQNWADLYLPAGEHRDHSVPLAVIIHGGVAQDGQGADSFDSLARALTVRGMAVYNIEYRRLGTGGGWPTTYNDIADALDHVVEVNEKFPAIATDDEVVVGHSTGAQFAAWGGTRHTLNHNEVGAFPAFRPTRIVSIAGTLDSVFSARAGDDRVLNAIGGTPLQVPARYATVDPAQNVDPGTPVVAIHGTADTVVTPENSRRYVEAAQKAGGKAELTLLEGEDHASIVSVDSPAYPKVVDAIVNASVAELDKVVETVNP